MFIGLRSGWRTGWIALGLSLGSTVVAGCSSDAAEDGASGATFGDVGTDGATAPGEETSAAEDGTAADEGGSSGGDPGATAGDDGTSGGEGGADGEACPEGQAPIGDGCVVCDPVAGAFDIDIPMIDVEIHVTIADADPPASELEDGQVYLRNLSTGDEVWLGNTHVGSFTRTVVPGDYAVFYEFESGGELVPVNERALVTTVTLFDDGTPMWIDIPMIQASGTFEIDGAEPGASPLESARIWLGTPHGDRVVLGDLHEGGYAKNVVAGYYEVYYEHLQGETVPVNEKGWLGSYFVDPESAEVGHVQDVPIQTMMAAGDITLNGAAPSASPAESADIVFVDAMTDEEIVAGHTHEGEFSALLVRGQYAVFYERIAGGEMVPNNKHAHLRDVASEVDAQMPIDIPAVTMSGSFRMGDGNPPPQDAGDDGLLTLRTAATGDSVLLGNTHDLVFSKLVIPGEYDVHYSHETAGPVLPINTNAKLATVAVPPGAGFQYEVDIPAVSVSGTITLNGGQPPDSEYEDGRIYLRDPISGDSVLLGSTRDGQFQGVVVPGLYDIVYDAETAGGEVPVNSEAVIGTVEILEAKDIAIDVPAATMSGAITVNQGPPPGTASDHGMIVLVDALTGDTIHLADTVAGQYARPLAAGTYVVHFRGEAWLGGVPANSNAPLGCIVLSN